MYIQKYICGDSIVQAPNRSGDNEQCDDGNTDNGDGCNILCQIDINPTATILYTPTS
ncbi:MAG: DUF4215 domain-containing protein [bacterium]